MIRRVLYFAKRFLLPHKWVFGCALFTGLLVSSTSALGIPVMLKYVFPVVFYTPNSGQETPKLLEMSPWLSELQMTNPSLVLLMACAALPFIFLLRGVFIWTNAMVVSYLGIRITTKLRMDVFSRVLELPVAFIEHREKGDLISRIMADTSQVQSVLTNIANDLFKQPTTCLVTFISFIYLLIGNGQSSLFLVNLVLIILAIVPIVRIGQRISKRAKEALTKLGKLNTTVQQNLETIREVRSYGMEDRQIQEFTRVADEYCRNSLKLVKYQRAVIPLMEVITSLALSYLLVCGSESGMQLPDFLALSAVLFFMFDSMKRTANAYNRLNEAQGALSRLEEILLAPNDMPEPENPVQLPPRVKGDITFRNVTFAYEEGKPVLHDVDVHIPAGQVVGLVGSSGAGKTTFASLIPRFYDVTHGALLIDGIDVRDMRRHDLREQLALVGQQALLFAGTIRENIALGRSGATEQDIHSAAASAAVTSFLQTQPKGINTLIGEGGNGLSGGQRQRVAIARAFVKDAPILILDEATASLDAESERDIQKELESLAKGRTTLIVAHRFSTIRHVDRILVFEHGRIVGDGPHEQLYATCPIYHELYDRQGID